jgi:hypothetical protein
MWMSPLKRLYCPAEQHRRTTEGTVEPSEQSGLRTPRIGTALLAAALLAAAAAYTVPRAADAMSGLDDPARIAGRALDGTFDAVIAQREIEATLAAQDSELAQSVIDLARARQITIDPALVEKVAVATAEAKTMRYRAKSLTRGLLTGEPHDMASLAGTTFGDLFVFGDIRDAVREGTVCPRRTSGPAGSGSCGNRHCDYSRHRDVWGRHSRALVYAYEGRAQDGTPGCRVHRDSRRMVGKPVSRPQRAPRDTAKSNRLAACCIWSGRRPCRKGRRRHRAALDA